MSFKLIDKNDLRKLKEYLICNNITNIKNKYGENILMYAINKNKRDIINFLINEYSNILLDTNNRNETVLHYAVKNNNLNLTKKIIEKNKNLIYLEDINDKTPLIYSKNEIKKYLLKIILQNKNKKDINVKNFINKIMMEGYDKGYIDSMLYIYHNKNIPIYYQYNYFYKNKRKFITGLDLLDIEKVKLLRKYQINEKTTVVPVYLEHHMNLLIFDNIQKKVYRFEPNGLFFAKSYDIKIKSLLIHFQDYKYCSTDYFSFNFQSNVNHDITSYEKGSCTLWCLFIMEMILKFKKINYLKLVEMFINSFDHTKISFLIRGIYWYFNYKLSIVSTLNNTNINLECLSKKKEMSVCNNNLFNILENIKYNLMYIRHKNNNYMFMKKPPPIIDNDFNPPGCELIISEEISNKLNEFENNENKENNDSNLFLEKLPDNYDDNYYDYDNYNYEDEMDYPKDEEDIFENFKIQEERYLQYELTYLKKLYDDLTDKSLNALIELYNDNENYYDLLDVDTIILNKKIFSEIQYLDDKIIKHAFLNNLYNQRSPRPDLLELTS